MLDRRAITDQLGSRRRDFGFLPDPDAGSLVDCQ